jgi:hypothetical protein
MFEAAYRVLLGKFDIVERPFVKVAARRRATLARI